MCLLLSGSTGLSRPENDQVSSDNPGVIPSNPPNLGVVVVLTRLELGERDRRGGSGGSQAGHAACQFAHLGEVVGNNG